MFGVAIAVLFRFDVMVNGGEAVTLQFQRSPFRPQTKTLYVPWNQIVSLPSIKMTLHEEMDSYKETTVDTNGKWLVWLGTFDDDKHFQYSVRENYLNILILFSFTYITKVESVSLILTLYTFLSITINPYAFIISTTL